MKYHILKSVFVFSVLLISEQLIAQTGPWNSPLNIAYSTDGINFTNNQVFQDSSGVPSITRDTNGVLVCAFQWFPSPMNGPHWDSVAVKFSYDNGLTWTDPTQCIFSGMPANFKRPFDPAIVCTDNGQFRMYYSSGPNGSMSLDTSVNTYSSISNDGIHYSFETGARWDSDSLPVIDPCVVKFKGIWHYSAPRGAPEDGAFHCSSMNGINFSPLATIASDVSHNWTGNMMDNDSDVRFYGAGNTGSIWYRASTDGNIWQSYINTNLTGGDPAAYKIDSANYIIVYVAPPYSGIVEPEQLDYSVYPNPAKDNIIIDLPSKGGIEIINSQGKVIEVFETAEGLFIINAGSFAPGIYFLKAITEKGTSLKKIVIQ